jgi:hypothetical protein
MEAFFAPITRFRDRYRDLYIQAGQGDFSDLVEVELTEGCAEEILLHRGFTWEDFYSAANGKIVWINPNVFFNLSLFDTSYQHDYERFLFVSGYEEDRTVFEVGVYASSDASATIVCDILLQLLTTCESRKITLDTDSEYNGFPVSGLAFSHFLIHSNHNLKVLSVDSLAVLSACHCHAMGASMRTDLQIDLYLYGGGTELGMSVLLESIRQNRGPTGLNRVSLDVRRLADALRGNSRVSSFSPWVTRDTSDEDWHAFFQALAENDGLVELNLTEVFISDENGDVLWQSLSRHPKLEILFMRTPEERGITDAKKLRRTQAIVDALRVNTVLHTIELYREQYDLKMLDKMVLPRLLVNRYRPRVAAIAEERGTWQRKLLGRALAAVSSNLSLNPIWMMVSGNVNVICGHTLRE